MEVRNYPGLPHPLQQLVREVSACGGGGTAPGTSSCAGWGSATQTQEQPGFWQPPGIRLQTRGAWFAELGVMEGRSRGVFGWVLPLALPCQRPVPLMWEPLLTPSKLNPRGVQGIASREVCGCAPRISCSHDSLISGSNG